MDFKEIQKATNPFEKFLEQICFIENPMILDDDMPDFFDNWLSELDGEDYLKHGNALVRFFLDNIK